MLHQLAVLIAVSLRCGNRAVGFDDEQAVVLAVEFHLVGRSPGDDHVVAVFEFHLAVHRLQAAAALVDENDLIGIGILEEVIRHTLARRRQDDLAIIIDQHRLSALEVIVFRLDAKAFQAAVLELFILNYFGNHRKGVADLNDLGGRVAMVEQGGEVAKAFGREELLVVELATRLSELGVPFSRHLSKAIVVHRFWF